MKILVTGANGFVGKSLCPELFRQGQFVRAAVRSADIQVENSETITIGAINGETDWTDALRTIKIVVHLAGRAHFLKDTAIDNLVEFRRVNVEGTLNLARQAADAGVKRLIFISSIKVNGEGTLLGHPFTAEDEPAPIDAYGISKREAEDALRLLAHDTGMEWVIIRPPLIYGPGVKANFQSMMSWLYKGIPLPLGTIYNQRSLVAMDNLIDLIATCIHHPAAANQTFLVSDGEDLSTSELLRRMALALGKTAWLVPAPGWALTAVAGLFGKNAAAQKLCDSLQADITNTCKVLDWSPPINVEEGLRRVAQAYLNDLH